MRVLVYMNSTLLLYVYSSAFNFTIFFIGVFENLKKAHQKIEII